MARIDRTKLYFGPYATPKFKLGQRVKCAVRGNVTIVKVSEGRIPWPMGRTPDNTNRMLIVYEGLEKAVRREAATAVCHWWGVTGQTVSKWRGTMKVGHHTEGNQLLRGHYTPKGRPVAQRKNTKAALAKAAAKAAAAKPVKKAAKKAGAKGRKSAAGKRAK